MELVRQNFVKRLIAIIIDGILLAIVGGVIGGILLAVTHSPYIVSIVTSLVMLAYTTLEIIKAQTIGKMVMKMKITNIDGSPASQQQLIKRWAIKNSASLIALVGAISTLSIISMASGLLGLAVLIGCFLVLKPERLAGHDLLAGTAVYGPEAMEFGAPTAAQLSPVVAK